jgi:putative hemolysin
LLVTGLISTNSGYATDPAHHYVAAPPGVVFHQGALRLRLALGAQDFRALARLRGLRFAPAGQRRTDRDKFDPLCTHLMIEGASSALLATARLRVLEGQAAYQSCYTAQYYDLAPLAAGFSRGLEIGRLCLAPGTDAPADVIRLLLAGVTQIGQAGAVDVLFGCASFHGADVARHAPALAWLGARHVAPAHLRPAKRMGASVALTSFGPARPEAARGVPPLLRMYLGLGGFVSDHAVIDTALDTLHVLVAVPVAHIPTARLHRLKDLGQSVASLPLGPDAPIS